MLSVNITDATKQNVLVTGARGYIGTSILRCLSNDFNITGLSRSDCDLTDVVQTDMLIDALLDSSVHFDSVVHCAVAGGSRNSVDSDDVISKNEAMFAFIVKLQKLGIVDRIINIGSGAEYDRRLPITKNSSRDELHPIDPYGLSKQLIQSKMNTLNNAFTLRVYGVFDENEISTRFIRSALLNYIYELPICVYKSINASMDFIYMQDFISILKLYLVCNVPHSLFKEVDCVYEDNISMYGISKFINTINDYSVQIIINDSASHSFNGSYQGDPSNLIQLVHTSNTLTDYDGIKLIGLREGIRTMYNKLKNV